MTGVDLRFLGAAQVEGPGGTFAGFEICSRDNETVGTLDGVLIDPPARRVRYFVLKLADRPTHCLLASEMPMWIEAERRVGWVESARADLELEPYDMDGALPFSDEDALMAMFPHRPVTRGSQKR
jgi:hypothetical protein